MHRYQHFICLCCLLALAPQARAQENAAMPRRYFAAHFATERKGPSFLPGLSFEYRFYRSRLLQLGLRATLTLGGSADSFGQAGLESKEDLYDYTKLGLGATGYLYPSGNGQGFLLCTELGFMRTFRFGLNTNNLAQGWAQGGAGWQWKLRQNTLRCTMALMYVIPDHRGGFRERMGLQAAVAMGF